MLNISVSLLTLTINLANIDKVLKSTVLPSDNLLYLSNDQDNIVDEISTYTKFVYSPNDGESDNQNCVDINLMITKMDAYVINLKQSENTAIIFMNLTKMRSWNPRAKFIINLEESDDELLNDIFKILSKHYIYNVIVVSNNELFTYFPYKYENLNKPYLNYEKIKPQEYFPNKIPNLWRNTTFKPVYMILVPYYFQYPPSGADFALMETIIKKRLQMSTNFSQSITWGVKQQNGEYSAALGKVQRKESDAMMGGGVYTQLELYHDFDTTDTYCDEIALWLVPIAREHTSFYELIMVFTKEAFILSLVSSILLTTAWILIPRWLPVKYEYYSSLWHGSTIILRFLCNEVEQRVTPSIQMRCLHFSTYIFVFIIGSAFTGEFFGNLITPIYEHQISTVQEVIDSDLHISMPGFIRYTYYVPSDEKKMYIFNRSTQEDNTLEIDKIIFRAETKRDISCYATLRAVRCRNWAKGISLPIFAARQETAKLFPLKDGRISFNLIQVFQKGHPMFKQINRILVVASESGIYQKILYDFTFLVYWRLEKGIRKSNERSKAIRFSQVEGLFSILLIALSLAFVVFCCELLIFYYKKPLNVYVN